VPHPAIDVYVLRAKAAKRLPPTTTTLSSSASQSPFGATVTLTATVLAGKRKAGNPTGTVTFKEGNTVLATVPVSIRKRIGTAAFSTSALAPGNHAIVATYSGNKRLAASSNATPVALLVPRVSTALTLTSPDTSPFGNPVTLTAKVAPSVPNPGPPTGAVTFTEGGTVLGTTPLQVVNGVAQAALMTSSLSTGSHAIVATYSGDGNFNLSSNASSPRTLQVIRAATTLKLTSSTTMVNGGDQISITAKVIPSGSTPVLPTGPVTFTEGSTVLATRTLQVVGGVAQAIFIPTASGTHTISAIYLGDVNFLGSTS
jgi:hypothetical protein